MATIDLRLDHTVGKGNRDVQTVTKSGESVAQFIAGVEVYSPINHVDHRGRMFELFPGEGGSPIWQEAVVYSYVFTVRSGQTKGWGLHVERPTDTR